MIQNLNEAKVALQMAAVHPTSEPAMMLLKAVREYANSVLREYPDDIRFFNLIKRCDEIGGSGLRELLS